MSIYLRPLKRLFTCPLLSVLLLSLISLQTLAAEETTPATSDSASLVEETVSNEVLLERTRQALETVTAVVTRLDELIQREAKLMANIDEKIIQREALAIPEVTVPETPPTVTEEAQTIVNAWEEHLKALTQHQELFAAQQELAKKHREAVLKLAGEHRLLAEAQEKLLPLAQDLQTRQQAGDVKDAEVPETLATIVERYQPDELVTQADKWQASAARDALMITAITEALKTLTTTLETATAAQQQANAWLDEANRRAEIAKEFEGRDFTDLTALFAMQLADWKVELELIDTQITVLQEKNAEFAQAEQAIADLAPPDPSQLTVEETIPSLKEAKQTLLIAEANVDFRRQRLAQLTTLQTDLQAQQETAQTTVEGAQKLLNTTIELAVLGNTISKQFQAMPLPEQSKNTLPEEVKTALLDTELSRLRQQFKVLSTQQAEETAQLTAMQDTLTKAETAITEAEATLAKQQKQVERETEWATFIQQAYSLETAELLKTFDKTIIDFDAAKTELETASENIARSRENYQATLQALEDFKDPNVLDNIQRKAEFKDWYQGEGLRLLETETTQQAADAETEGNNNSENVKVAEEEAKLEQDSTESANDKPITKNIVDLTQQQLTETRKLRDEWVVRYIAALQEWQDLRADALGSLKAFEEQATAHLNVLEKAFSLSRQAWGGATTLQTRSGRGEIAVEDLPAAVTDWVSREQIVTLQGEIKKLQTELTTVTERHAVLQDSAGFSVFAEPFDNWKSNLDRQIDQLRNRLDLERGFIPPDPDKMNEFEKYRFDRRVEERLLEDESWYELVVGALVSKQMEGTNKLFTGYYEQLSDFEYQLDNVAQRRVHTNKLIDLHEATREIFATLETTFADIVKQSSVQLDVYLTQLKAVFNPAQSAELLAALKERTDITVTTSELPQLPSSADEEARLKAEQALLTQLLEYWAGVEGYQALLKTASYQQAELGGVDKTVDGLKDVVARLDSTRDELNQSVAKLTGNAVEVLQALPPEDRMQTAQERALFLKGEIGLLRDERLSEMNWAAINTVGWLIFIPFAAFLVIYTVNFIGQRKLSKISREAEAADASDDAIDREARFKMLFHVSSTALTFLVVVLAVIYMFKAVNVDVLPLLASAGVLGLAVAFGAQRLVSDFFSGFFILLENQFRRGDSVEVNGIRGQVERLTPRMTVIRDSAEGGLHYVPNGGIANVSNLSRQQAWTKVEVPVGYHEEHDTVMALLEQTTTALRADPEWGQYIFDTSIQGMNAFEDYAVIYGVRVETRAGEQYAVARELRKMIKLAFEQNGIKIPQRVMSPQADVAAAPAGVSTGGDKPVLGAKG